MTTKTVARTETAGNAAAHTPGPWSIRCLGGFGEDGLPMASVWIESDQFTSVASLIPHRGVQGNAFLIAAAPDLLAALKRVECFCPVAVQDEIRSLVAKAEGRAA